MWLPQKTKKFMDQVIDPSDGGADLIFAHRLALTFGIPVRAMRDIITALDDLVVVVLLHLITGHVEGFAYRIPDVIAR